MTRIAREYAEALFALARETGEVQAFADGLAVMRDAFAGEPEYLELLSCPKLPIEEREALLEAAFSGAVAESVLSLAQLLCAKGHIREFEACAREYERFAEAFASVSKARVVSAVPLTDPEKEALTKKLEKISGHVVAAQYEVDASLLGGAAVYMDGAVIDGSLKHQLKEAKEVIGV